MSNYQSDPIVQIAVETEKPNDIPLLLEQLRLLDSNDSSIRISQMVSKFNTLILYCYSLSRKRENILSAL